MLARQIKFILVYISHKHSRLNPDYVELGLLLALDSSSYKVSSKLVVIPEVDLF